MEMVIQSSSLIVANAGEELYCGEFRGPRAEGTFKEINSYWNSLTKSEAKSLFEIYRQVHELVMCNMDVDVKVFRTILDDMHPEEHIIDHIDKIAYPKNATEVFIPHKHYTVEETYTRGEYRQLAILAIRLRALMPILAMEGMFQHQKTGQGASVMFKALAFMAKLEDCEISNSDGFERLKVYIEATSQKILETKRSNVIGSILDGIGTSDLPQYLMGVGIILGVVPTSITSQQTNLAKAVNNKISDELTKKIIRRFNITDERPGEKMAQGEDSKMGYFETYQSRQEVPDMIPMMNGVWALDYRKARHAMGIESKPSLIKSAIDSATKNPYSQFTPVHRFIIRAAMRRHVLHQTIQDISFDLITHMVGLTQIFLIEHKLFGLARLLSSDVKDVKSSGDEIQYNRVNVNSLDKNTIEFLDRYYTNSVPNPRGSSWVKPYVLSIDAQTNHLNQYFWEQKASKDMCALLGTENGKFTPTADFKNELGQLLAMTAPAK